MDEIYWRLIDELNEAMRKRGEAFEAVVKAARIDDFTWDATASMAEEAAFGEADAEAQAARDRLSEYERSRRR